jgi:hypothetical protein
MKKAKYIFVLVAVISLSSCGIFRKGCGCPHFSKMKADYKAAGTYSKLA